MTRHFGVFQFKPEITQEQIDESFVALADLANKIPGLLSVQPRLERLVVFDFDINN